MYVVYSDIHPACLHDVLSGLSKNSLPQFVLKFQSTLTIFKTGLKQSSTSNKTDKIGDNSTEGLQRSLPFINN